MNRGRRTHSSTTTSHHKMRKGQLSICFPSYYQVPIDVTAGWDVSPVNMRSPFNRWVNWSNASKVSCSRKQQQQHQSVLSGNQTSNLPISRPVPQPLGYATQTCTHTPPPHTHTHAHMHAHIHTHTHTTVLIMLK